MPVYVVGDSLTKLLEKDLALNVQVFCFPGATIKSLRHHVKTLTALPPPSKVILHVGTNSLTDHASHWTSNLLQLIEAVRTTFQCPSSSIQVSPVLPRWDSDYLYSQSLHLNSTFREICQRENIDFVDFSDNLIPEHNYAADGIHLTRNGYFLFANELEGSISKCDRCVSTRPKWPRSMIPPLTRTLTKKEQKKRKRMALDQGATKEKPARNQPSPTGPQIHRQNPAPKLPSDWATVNRGHRATPTKRKGQVVKITYKTVNEAQDYRVDFGDMPKQPSPYVKAKKAGKAKTRKKKRLRRKRAKNRERQQVGLVLIIEHTSVYGNFQRMRGKLVRRKNLVKNNRRNFFFILSISVHFQWNCFK